MKNSLFLKIVALSFFFMPLIFMSCEEDKPKCERDTVTQQQNWTVFWNLYDYATIYEDGTIEYLLKNGFLEVCTYSKMAIDVQLKMKPNPPLPFGSAVRVQDADGSVGYDWTLLEYNSAGNYYYKSAFNIEIPADLQNTAVWVDVKLTVLPGHGYTVDEVHDIMGEEMFENLFVDLIHNKPNY